MASASTSQHRVQLATVQAPNSQVIINASAPQVVPPPPTYNDVKYMLDNTSLVKDDLLLIIEQLHDVRKTTLEITGKKSDTTITLKRKVHTLLDDIEAYCGPPRPVTGNLGLRAVKIVESACLRYKPTVRKAPKKIRIINATAPLTTPLLPSWSIQSSIPNTLTSVQPTTATTTQSTKRKRQSDSLPLRSSESIKKHKSSPRKSANLASSVGVAPSAVKPKRKPAKKTAAPPPIPESTLDATTKAADVTATKSIEGQADTATPSVEDDGWGDYELYGEIDTVTTHLAQADSLSTEDGDGDDEGESDEDDMEEVFIGDGPDVRQHDDSFKPSVPPATAPTSLPQVEESKKLTGDVVAARSAGADDSDSEESGEEDDEEGEFQLDSWADALTKDLENEDKPAQIANLANAEAPQYESDDYSSTDDSDEDD